MSDWAPCALDDGFMLPLVNPCTATFGQLAPVFQLLSELAASSLAWGKAALLVCRFDL
jgi:hypothetical protein